VRPAGHARSNVYIETRYETDGVSWPDVRRTQLVEIFRETFGFYFPKPPYATGPWPVGGTQGKVAEVFQNGGKSEEKFVKQRLIFSV